MGWAKDSPKPSTLGEYRYGPVKRNKLSWSQSKPVITGRLSVMDVVELNPLLSSPSTAIRSAQVMVEIIARAFTGKRMRHSTIQDDEI